MLTDRYELPLSTGSVAARDAYVAGCAAKLTNYPGALEAFARAISADPRFALSHVARAHVLLERGDAAGARAAMAAAKSLVAGVTAREASHVAYLICWWRGTPKPRSRRCQCTSTPGRATRGAGDRRVHQRADRQLGSRWAEAHAAGAAGGARPGLWRRLVVRGASRHGAVGERRARGRRPEDRPLASAEPEKPVGGACPRASLLRGRRCRRGSRVPRIVAAHLSARRCALQPFELASRARRPRSGRCGDGAAAVPGRLRARCS